MVCRVARVSDAGQDHFCNKHLSRRRIRMAAGTANAIDILPCGRSSCLRPKPFTEIPDQIQPQLRVAVETIHDRCKLCVDSVDLVPVKLTPHPVQPLLVLIQRYRKTTFLLPGCRLVTHPLPR